MESESSNTTRRRPIHSSIRASGARGSGLPNLADLEVKLAAEPLAHVLPLHHVGPMLGGREVVLPADPVGPDLLVGQLLEHEVQALLATRALDAERVVALDGGREAEQ